MKEITIKTYEFHELSEKAQKRVLEKYSDINGDDEFWPNQIIDNFEARLKEWGVNDPDYSYSGFYSQGDGACFWSNSLDLVKAFTRMKECSYFDVPQSWISAAENGELIATIVKFNHRYSHSNTIIAEAEYTGTGIENEMEHVEIVITEWAKDLSNEFYRELEREWEAINSEAAVIAEIQARKWVFTESGQHISILV